LPNETRNYVPKLLAALIIGKNPRKFGFEVTQGRRAIAQTTLRTTRPLSLEGIAREASIDLRLLENLNPELRHGITPPPTTFRPFYELKIPEASQTRVESAIATLAEAPLTRVVAGKVNRRDTAANFARQVGIPLSEFLNANARMTAKTKLAKGQTVMLPLTLGSGQYDKLTSSQNKKSKKKSYKKASYKYKKSKKKKR
jgi:membrane-bound lytic murein transglycosylase D